MSNFWQFKVVYRCCCACLQGIFFIGPTLLWGTGCQDEEAWSKHFHEASYQNSKQQTLNYRVMKPEIDEGKQYPLVLFLHGAGERGDNNRAQLVHGMRDFASSKNRRDYPAWVIAPQCPRGEKWVDIPWDGTTIKMPEEPSRSLTLCRELIDQLVSEEPTIDPNRIYVTGLSMGGFGTYDAVCRWPELFAAAAPICGGGDDRPEIVNRLKQIPLWVAHGDADAVVKPELSRRMVAAINAIGGDVKYIEMKGIGHDSWTATYADPKFMAWLFSQSKRDD